MIAAMSDAEHDLLTHQRYYWQCMLVPMNGTLTAYWHVLLPGNCSIDWRPVGAAIENPPAGDYCIGLQVASSRDPCAQVVGVL